MKNVADMIKNFIEKSNFDPEEKVTHVWNAGRFEILSTPKFPQQMTCPMCSGRDGYRVTDGKIREFCGWSCSQEECISNRRTPTPHKPFKLTLENRGVPEILVDANFENIYQSPPVIEQLKKYCEKFQGFLLLPGNSGTGKSYASVCCMVKYLGNHSDCWFLNVADLFVRWLSLKQSGESELYLLERYGECDLLILDDLGTRTPSEAFLDFIYLLINKRWGKIRTGTIISTNLGYQELAQKVGDAILSRITSGMIVKFTGEDRRKPKF